MSGAGPDGMMGRLVGAGISVSIACKGAGYVSGVLPTMACCGTKFVDGRRGSRHDVADALKLPIRMRRSTSRRESRKTRGFVNDGCSLALGAILCIPPLGDGLYVSAPEPCYGLLGIDT